MAVRNKKWDGLARPNEPQRKQTSSSGHSRKKKIRRWRIAVLISGGVIVLLIFLFAAILSWNGFDLSGVISFGAFPNE